MTMGMAEKIKALREAVAGLGQDTRPWTDDELVRQVLTGGPKALPSWADLSAADRIASLREDAVRFGEDITHLSDTELLNQELNRIAAESRRHENAYSSLLQDSVRNDRSIRAAAHRSATHDFTSLAGIYLQAIIRRNASPIEGVIYRAEQIPEDGRMPVTKARELREAALKARWMLRGMSSDSTIEDAQKDEGVQLAEKLRTEIHRVAQIVGAYGTKLHNQASGDHTRDEGGRCVCVGCELIRTVNDPEENGE